MSHRHGRIAAIAAILALACAPAGAQTTDKAEDPVVASVNGVELYLSDIADAQQSLPEQYRAMAPSLIMPALRERLIDFALMTIEGRKADLQDDELVKRRLVILEDQLIREVYIQSYLDGVLTEDGLRQRYDAFVASSPPKEEARVRHILVETEEEAKAAIARIAEGAAFADVAKDTSTGPSAGEGGDLGYIARDQVVAEFAEAAFALQAGEMTEAPVKTGFGWHAILVEERRTAPPPSFETVRPQLASEMSQQAIADLLAKLREKATIEYFDAADASSGAEPAGDESAEPAATGQ